MWLESCDAQILFAMLTAFVAGWFTRDLVYKDRLKKRKDKLKQNSS